MAPAWPLVARAQGCLFHRMRWELRSDAGQRVRSAGVVSIAAVAGLLLAPMTSGSAHAETAEGNPGGAIGLGARGWSAAATNQARPLEQLDFSARAGFAPDYIYRGTDAGRSLARSRGWDQ